MSNVTQLVWVSIAIALSMSCTNYEPQEVAEHNKPLILERYQEAPPPIYAHIYAHND